MCQFLIVMLLNLTRIIRVSCTFPLQSFIFSCKSQIYWTLLTKQFQ